MDAFCHMKNATVCPINSLLSPRFSVWLAQLLIHPKAAFSDSKCPWDLGEIGASLAFCVPGFS